MTSNLTESIHVGSGIYYFYIHQAILSIRGKQLYCNFIHRIFTVDYQQLRCNMHEPEVAMEVEGHSFDNATLRTNPAVIEDALYPCYNARQVDSVCNFRQLRMDAIVYLSAKLSGEIRPR